LQSGTRIYYDYSKNDYPYINRGIGNIDPSTGEIINPVEKNDNADYTRFGLLQELYYRVNNRNILSARWWWQQAERTIPRATSYEGPDNTNLNKQQDVDNRLVADWKNYGKTYRLLLRSGYAGKNLDYSLKNNTPGLGEVSAIYSESRQDSWMNHVSFKYDLDHGFSLETSVDIDYHHVETGDTVTKTGYTKDRMVMSLFAAIRKGFGDRLNLNLMIRQDWIDFNVVPVTPYFGFDLRVIRERDLIFKGNIARNYHYPTLNDLYWQPGGNPGLKPEQGYSYELGLEYKLDLKKLGLSTELSAFRSDINDWIIWVPSYRGYWEPRNIDRVLSQGIEYSIGLQGLLGKVGYKVAGSYAYTGSVNYGDPLTWGDESYGKQLVYIPLHSGNLMVNLSYRGFYATYQHNSYSERFTTSSNDISRRDWLYPYYMNDLIIGKEFRIRKVAINAEFKIYNLFDETYHSVLYRPMPGRNYMLMLMIKYQK
jgi:iron complex outermembrane receptor protein